MRFFIFTFLILHCVTSHGQNTARLYSSNGALFSVYFNDRLQNKTPQASVVLENMKQDTLYLKVEFENTPRQGVSIYLLNKGKGTSHMEFVYRFSLNNGKIGVSFEGMYDEAKLPEPLVPKEPTADTSANYKNSVFGHLCELKNGNMTYFNNLPGTGLCKNPMPNEYLTYASFLASKTTLNSQRSLIAENVCSNNCLNVEQLNKLLPYMEFELDKIRLVHMAYFNLVDTANAKQLLKQFKLAASISELNNFFGNSEKYRMTKKGNCKTADEDKIMNDYLLLISNCNNDNQRLEFLRKSFNVHCYSVTQINTVLKAFVHEREKLESAKLLYSNCVEKEKYAEVRSSFVYKENINELNDFIEKQK